MKKIACVIAASLVFGVLTSACVVKGTHGRITPLQAQHQVTRGH